MNSIDCKSLKERLARGHDCKLVMALPDWAFRAAHIPGSLHFATTDDMLAQLDIDDDIVVYCSHSACSGSRLAYRQLEAHGYRYIARLEGGLHDWSLAGYPLAGTASA